MRAPGRHREAEKRRPMAGKGEGKLTWGAKQRQSFYVNSNTFGI